MKSRLLLFIALTALIGWVFAEPYFAAYRLAHAIKSQDIAAIDELVDYRTLQDNLKTRFRSKMEEGFEGRPGLMKNPIVALGLAAAGAVTDQLVANCVTPEALKQLLNGHPAPALEAAQPENPVPTAAPNTVPALPGEALPKPKRKLQLGYMSPNAFFIDVIRKDDESQRHPRLILSRVGWFTWKLSDIQIL